MLDTVRIASRGQTTPHATLAILFKHARSTHRLEIADFLQFRSDLIDFLPSLYMPILFQIDGMKIRGINGRILVNPNESNEIPLPQSSGWQILSLHAYPAMQSKVSRTGNIFYERFA